MHRQQTTKALACSVPMGTWAWLAKRCLALIPSSLEMPTWALAFFFFFSFNDNSQETWESGGRSSSNRHIWRGRKGLEERTSTQAEVNMANSKLLGDNFFPNPCWHPPLWEEQGNEADDKWTRRAKEHSWWFWTWLWQHKDFLPHGVGSGLTGLRCR